MTPKKKKNPADDLIDSLMEDLKKDAAEDPTALLPSESLPHIPVPTSADDRTVAVPSAPPHRSVPSVGSDPEPKVSFGVAKSSARYSSPGMSQLDSNLQQADTLKLAQKRILDLETHLEKIRGENEQLSSIAEMAKSREEELILKIQQLEKSKAELRDQSSQEINIFRDNLQAKDFETTRLKMRIEELESRLQADLKKIRVRERELENRLELAKVEKNALLKTKDENILDLKRKMDQLFSELETYKQKCTELTQKIEMNNEQFSRTVRALRLALTNLEANENTSSMILTAVKKAE